MEGRQGQLGRLCWDHGSIIRSGLVVWWPLKVKQQKKKLLYAQKAFSPQAQSNKNAFETEADRTIVS